MIFLFENLSFVKTNKKHGTPAIASRAI